ELELRDLAHAESRLQVEANELRRALQGGERRRPLVVIAEHTHENPGGAEVRRDLHLGNAEESDARILHFPPDDVVELLLEELAYLSCPSCHGRSRTFRGGSAPRGTD